MNRSIDSSASLAASCTPCSSPCRSPHAHHLSRCFVIAHALKEAGRGHHGAPEFSHYASGPKRTAISLEPHGSTTIHPEQLPEPPSSCGHFSVPSYARELVQNRSEAIYIAWVSEVVALSDSSYKDYTTFVHHAHFNLVQSLGRLVGLLSRCCLSPPSARGEEQHWLLGKPQDLCRSLSICRQQRYRR